MYVGSQQGYGNSQREDEVQAGRGSDRSVPSPGSERSVGRNSGFGGYSSAQSSRAYHNPVYLRHRDAVMACGNDSSNDNPGPNKNGNGNFGHDRPQGYSPRTQTQYADTYSHQQNQSQTNSNYNTSQTRDFNQNNYNYKGQQYNSGPSSPRQMRFENGGPGRSAQDGSGRYNQSYSRVPPQSQSPYDADVSRVDSRLDDSRVDQRVNHRAAPPADPLRIESRGYGATLHRRSAGVPYNSNYGMSSPPAGQGTLSSQYQSNQVDGRSSNHSFGHSSDRRPNRISYEDANRAYGSSPPKNISR